MVRSDLELGGVNGGIYGLRDSLQPCATSEFPPQGVLPVRHVKIISRYVIREHLGPLAFSATALTSLMLLNYIAKNFGNLVGKGLPARVIAEFFLLAVPFTVAMTLPMAVLVAVLYAFSRLASENEITAFKASGVSMLRLMRPALAGGLLFSVVMMLFNDQILPRANHRLARLQRDILRTSPTFALKEQVVNPVKEGQLYLRAGRITRGTSEMRDVVLYDLTDPTRRRTIFADSGRLAMAPNRRDIHMTLYAGVMREVPTDRPEEVTQLYYAVDQIRVKDVANSFSESEGSSIRGEREMSVCEMQQRLVENDVRYQRTAFELQLAIIDSLRTQGKKVEQPRKFVPQKPKGIGHYYCQLQQRIAGWLQPPAAQAAVPRHLQDTLRRQDTARQQDTLRRQDSTQRQDTLRNQDTLRARIQDSIARARTDSVRLAAEERARNDSILAAMQDAAAARRAAGETTAAVIPTPIPPGVTSGAPAPLPGAPAVTTVPESAPIPEQSPYSRVKEAKDQLGLARQARNKYEVEIHKKFALAAACVIFVLVGAPLALRFPRGGVGMVIGASLVIFAVSYVGLIGGEALADKALLSPFIAMWGANMILLVIGILLPLRMGRENTSGRGGGFGEWLGGLRLRRRRAAAQAQAIRTA